MGNIIVPLEGEFAPQEARGWEGRVFRRVCTEGQREAAAYLEALDEALYEQRPGDWAVVGFRERAVVTRFGGVSIRRRLYRDERGKYHPLLDELRAIDIWSAMYYTVSGPLDLPHST